VLKSRMISSDYIALNSEQQISKNSKGIVIAAFEEPLATGTEENQEKYQVRIVSFPAKIKKLNASTNLHETYKSCVEYD
jgi:hypothetical protein